MKTKLAAIAAALLGLFFLSRGTGRASAQSTTGQGGEAGTTAPDNDADNRVNDAIAVSSIERSALLNEVGTVAAGTYVDPQGNRVTVLDMTEIEGNVP